MNEDIHNGEESFKKAYRHMEESPSPEVWEKISARLDNIDSVYNRNRFVIWKRIACIVLLLASSAGAYEIFFNHKDNSVTKVVFENNAHNPGGEANTEQLSTDSSVIVQQQKSQPLNKIHSFSDTRNDLNSSFDHNRHLYRLHLNDHEKKGIDSIQNMGLANKLVTLQDNSNLLKDQPYIDQPGLPTLKQSKVDEVPTKNSINEINTTVETMDEKHPGNKDTADLFAASKNIFDKQQYSKQARKAAQSISLKQFNRYWTLTPYASVDFTQYTLDDDDSYNGNDPEDKQDIKQRERHQFSFSAGVLARWQFSPKISLKTGLVYSNIAIGIQPQTLYATLDNNQTISYKFITSSGYAYLKPVFGTPPAAGDSITADISQHHLQYLNLPLMVSYTILMGKRFSVTPGVGVSASTLLSTRVETEINEDTDTEAVVINKLQGLRKTYFSFTADAELQYFVSKHTSITALPIFKYAINPITKNNVVRTYPYSIGLGLGISYRF
jgi:hypothetical protein